MNIEELISKIESVYKKQESEMIENYRQRGIYEGMYDDFPLMGPDLIVLLKRNMKAALDAEKLNLIQALAMERAIFEAGKEEVNGNT